MHSRHRNRLKALNAMKGAASHCTTHCIRTTLHSILLLPFISLFFLLLFLPFVSSIRVPDTRTNVFVRFIAGTDTYESQRIKLKLESIGLGYNIN